MANFNNLEYLKEVLTSPGFTNTNDWEIKLISLSNRDDVVVLGQYGTLDNGNRTMLKIACVNPEHCAVLSRLIAKDYFEEICSILKVKKGTAVELIDNLNDFDLAEQQSRVLQAVFTQDNLLGDYAFPLMACTAHFLPRDFTFLDNDRLEDLESGNNRQFGVSVLHPNLDLDKKQFYKVELGSIEGTPTENTLNIEISLASYLEIMKLINEDKLDKIYVRDVDSISVKLDKDIPWNDDLVDFILDMFPPEVLEVLE